jgi:hypothetical protein
MWVEELDMFQSIFVSFNTDFDHFLDDNIVTSLDNFNFRSERVVPDVLASHKGTVKPPFVVALHDTECPIILHLASTLHILPFGGATIIAFAANAASAIAVNGRTFIVAQRALKYFASFAGSPLF